MYDVENAVVVVIDALRADRVGALGDDRGLTPNIDDLASSGTTFTQAFSCSNATDPSITSIITGCQPRRSILHHGGLITQAEKQRIESLETLPERLQRAGVHTIATGRPMGRWHTRGYDVHPHVSQQYPTLYRIGGVLKRIHPKLREFAATAYHRTIRGGNGDAANEITAVDRLLEEIDGLPFFGFVHLMDTHTPYSDDEALVSELLDAQDYPEGDLESVLEELGDAPLANSLKNWLTEADFDRGLARVCARYDAGVVEADRKVGQLLEALEARNLLEETAVFVLSDHGESLVEHDIFFDHHGLYDESIHVPLICDVHNNQPGVRDELVQLTDVMPSILDLLELDRPESIDGRSLLPLLDRDGLWEPRDAIFAEETYTQRRIALRTERWKFIDHREDEQLERTRGDSLECGYCGRRHDDPPVLFDLKDDPDETQNVSKEFRDTVERLSEEVRDREQAMEEPIETADEKVTYDDEEGILDRLEQLGYR